MMIMYAAVYLNNMALLLFPCTCVLHGIFYIITTYYCFIIAELHNVVVKIIISEYYMYFENSVVM